VTLDEIVYHTRMVVRGRQRALVVGDLPFGSYQASPTQAVESAKSDKTVFDALELSALNSRVEGDVGVVTGINRLKGKDSAGKAFDRSIRFTDTFIKRDGRWQVWATLSKAGVTLTAGTHVLRVVMDANGPGGSVANFNWLKVR